MKASRPSALLIQLEFPTWKLARPWTYSANYAIQEGLSHWGVECLTVPAIYGEGLNQKRSWLSVAKQMYHGRHFDQVWVWLLHYQYDPAFLEWIAQLAPIRIGILMESMRYPEHVYAEEPGLRNRAKVVQQQVAYLTHLLTYDEYDADEMNSKRLIKALWWPPGVLRECIAKTPSTPQGQQAVFHGSLYGKRQAWLEHPRIRQMMTTPAKGQAQTEFQSLFDDLQAQSQDFLNSSPDVQVQDLVSYSRQLQQIRKGEFLEWMQVLRRSGPIVNLPSYAHFYGGRVFEGMAAGIPILSWDIPDRPMNRFLFEPDHEILLFNQHDPTTLVEQLERLQQDSDYAQFLATNALRTIRTYHTIEQRVHQALEWVSHETLPQYGKNCTVNLTHQDQKSEMRSAQKMECDSTHYPTAPSTERYRQESLVQSIGTIPVHTTVFIITIEDITYPACYKAVQEQSYSNFTVDVISNYRPMNVAFQEMIMRCETEFFIQVDEDMILESHAVKTMEDVMRTAPDDVGMICFHLYDEDREEVIEGIKIYRAKLMKNIAFHDVKSCEMDILDQMGKNGVNWILHPAVMGRHGTLYTPDRIYRRYKTMYEKDILEWNVMVSDIRKKAAHFRETGDVLSLFAMLGAADAIATAPFAKDREKDYLQYHLPAIDVFSRLFLETPPGVIQYDPKATPKRTLHNRPLPFEQIQWKRLPAVRGESTVQPSKETSDGLRFGVESEFSSLESTLRQVETPNSQPTRELEDQFYEKFFIEDPVWSTPEPNNDEKMRWTKIEQLLKEVSHRFFQTGSSPMRILDVGCGRGWLTNMSSQYGHCEGIEPVTKVVEYARSLFPHLTFFAGRPDELLTSPEFIPYDLIVTSEVIEHIPHAEKPHFIKTLKRLLTPSGSVILTTPRGEVWDIWQHVASPEQPVEDWITEESLQTLFEREGFHYLSRDRIHFSLKRLRYVLSPEADESNDDSVIGLYQVWAFEKNQITQKDTRPSWLVHDGADIDDEQERVDDQQENPASTTTKGSKQDLLITIALVTYNQDAFIQEALRSVLTQQFSNFEILIYDDASTDSTPSILDKVTDARVRILRGHQNFGEAAARNRCVQEARGKWILWLDSDDVLLPHVLSKYEQAIQRWPGIDVFYGDIEITGQNKTVLGRQEYQDWYENRRQLLALLFWRNCLHHGGSLIKKTSYEVVGPYDSIMSYAPDYEWWSRAAVLLDIKHIGQCVYQYRQHSESLSSQSVQIRCRWVAEIVKRMTAQYSFPQLFPDLDWKTEDQQTLFARSLYRISRRLAELFNFDDAKMFAGMSYQLVPTEKGRQHLEDLRRKTTMVGQGFSLSAMPSDSGLSVSQGKNGEKAPFTNFQDRNPLNGGGPMVSVIVPTYNRPKGLRVALESVLSQTWRDFEVIVVNDGGEAVESVVNELNADQKITYIQHSKNRGLGAARNSGIGVARGKYISYLDDDDWFGPTHLETLVECLEKNGQDFAYTDAIRIHQKKVGDEYVEVGKDLPYSQDFNPNLLLVTNYFPVLCVLHKKSLLEQSGGFDEALTSHEDWDLWIRMSRISTFVHIKKTTASFSWRTDGTSMTSRLTHAYIENIYMIHQKYYDYAKDHPQIIEKQQSHIQELRLQNHESFDCSIIIPVFNKVELTRQCLVQLAKVTNGVSYEVIVIDNHSTDGTAEFLSTLKGDIQVVTNEENLGFAKACNQGAEAARGKYLVFLNNDTIPQKGWLSSLVAEAETHENIAIVGSKLLFADGTLQHVGVAFSRNLLTPFHIYRGLPNDGVLGSNRREFQAVTAACMLVKHEWFEKVEGFDECYQNGFEDVDFCLKIRERGGKIIYQPNSWMYHLESQSPGRINHEQVNASLFLSRWKDKLCVDEDLIAMEDGMILETIYTSGRFQYSYRVLNTEEDIAAARNVADLQRLLFQLGDQAELQQRSNVIEKIHNLLLNSSEWPSDFDIRKWVGLTCMRFQLYTQAEYFLRSVHDVQDDLDVRKALATLALMHGDVAEAPRYLGRVLTECPHDGEAWNLKGIYNIQCKEFSEAIVAFQRAIQCEFNIRKAQLGLGMAYVGSGCHQQAWDAFMEVLKINPDDVEGMNWLLQVGTELADWDGLSKHLRTFLERNPANCDMRYALAGVLVRCGNMEEARSQCQTLQLLKPDYQGLQELAGAIEDSKMSFKAAANS